VSIYCGLMSGTSMDGIDAALVDMRDHTLIAGLVQPYTLETQRRLQGLLSEKKTELDEIGQLNIILGREFAEAALSLLKKNNLSAQQISAIGSHGQTILHQPKAPLAHSMQLGCPHTIAAMTGCSVVADFRSRDIALGGQGAPLAPLYHPVLFGNKQNEPMAVVNIGGVANITFIQKQEALGGYDCGPGNGLMDAWIQQRLGERFDVNGRWARQGSVIRPLLAQLYDDSYFIQRAPKSLDKSYFSLNWLQPYLKPEYKPEDVQATLLALTVQAITQAIEAEDLAVTRVIICGGGAHNGALLYALSQDLKGRTVGTSESVGIDSDYVEAMMMAWLAAMAMEKRRLPWHKITGAKSEASVLGITYG